MKLETFSLPSLAPFPQWMCSLPIVLTFLALSSPSFGQPINFRDVGEINPSEILAVSSDQEAAAVFMKIFGRELVFSISQGMGRQKPTPNPVSAEVSNDISHFMAYLLISVRAKEFRTAIQSGSLQSQGQLNDEKSPQYQWLLSKARSNELTQFTSLAGTISQFSQELPPQSHPAPPQFSTFAQYFDQTYPELIGAPDSWISILEDKGMPAIRTRFNEFWERPQTGSSIPDSIPGVSPEHQKEYAQFYLKTRLLPVFVSHLVAKSIRLQASAEQEADQRWVRLTRWKESEQKLRALTRLCGMWQWTVHNHQNHQDHKMTMTFSPSLQQLSGQPQPDLVIMNGDTVYLKWTFPSGFQEDSLLLSNRDQRLEGTFTNSRGPHGSISGKRLSTCSP